MNLDMMTADIVRMEVPVCGYFNSITIYYILLAIIWSNLLAIIWSNLLPQVGW